MRTHIISFLPDLNVWLALTVSNRLQCDCDPEIRGRPECAEIAVSRDQRDLVIQTSLRDQSVSEARMGDNAGLTSDCRLILATGMDSSSSLTQTVYVTGRQKRRDEIPYGTLDMLILKTLSTAKEMHGFQIADCIQENTESVLNVEEGSLYPALQRLLMHG